MKRSVVAGLGAGIILALGASSSAQAAIVSFGFGAFDGSIGYIGPSLDASTTLDLDSATFLVMEVNPGDSSGLADFDSVSLIADTAPPGRQIIYGSTPGPLGANVILSWPMAPGPGADVFTETLTTTTAMDRSTPNAITVTLTGTLTDTAGLFTDTPAMLVLHAMQADGSGFPVVTFANTAGVVSTPEASTWAMMALGFAALGYAGVRRRKARIAFSSP